MRYWLLLILTERWKNNETIEWVNESLIQVWHCCCRTFSPPGRSGRTVGWGSLLPGNLDVLSRIKRSTIIIKVHDNDYTLFYRRKKLPDAAVLLIMSPGVQESPTKYSSLCSMKNLLAKFRINCSDINVIDDLHIGPKSDRSVFPFSIAIALLRVQRVE